MTIIIDRLIKSKMALKPVSGKTTVVVHPLVLLSVVDHYNRACKATRHRAVGVLLGSWKKGNILDVANSFASITHMN